jgi:hypothetical protein
MASSAAALDRFLAEIKSDYRNAAPLLAALEKLLKDWRGVDPDRRAKGAAMVELGSGACEHAAFFTHFLTAAGRTDNEPLIASWQPTDLREANKVGAGQVAKYIGFVPENAGVLKPPKDVDASSAEDWEAVVAGQPGGYDCLFSSCTFHIMSWPIGEAAIRHIGRIVLSRQPGSFAAIYGPLNYNGEYTSESNRRFDLGYLKQTIGNGACIKDFEAMRDVAQSVGLEVGYDIEMPENNRLLVLRRPLQQEDTY